LQCVAVCGSVLQCVAVHCSVLQCVAVCCSVLQSSCFASFVSVKCSSAFFRVSFGEFSEILMYSLALSFLLFCFVSSQPAALER